MAALPKIRVTVEPLWSDATPSHGPFLIGTLLRVDGSSLLLDCGWTEALDAGAVLPPLRRVAPSLDAVLVSFGDLPHAGALPLLYRPSAEGGGGCRAPMFVTPPAQVFAQRALFDAFQSRAAVEEAGWERDAFTLEDVSRAFNMREFDGPMEKVRFTEESAVRGDVLVTAYAAGHQLGGAMWRVVKGAESVVYAPRVNHKAELHLPKALLATVLRSPSALIVDGGFAGGCLLGGGGSAAAAAAAGAGWALPKPPPAMPGSRGAGPKEVWQRTLLEACVWTLQQGGSVLLPCDTTGRGLEVLMRLDSLYGTHYPWPIYYVGHTAKDVRYWGPAAPAPPLLSRRHTNCSHPPTHTHTRGAHTAGPRKRAHPARVHGRQGRKVLFAGRHCAQRGGRRRRRRRRRAHPLFLPPRPLPRDCAQLCG
jgi:cleavage and polyadenylation specificity factor subunit 2